MCIEELLGRKFCPYILEIKHQKINRENSLRFLTCSIILWTNGLILFFFVYRKRDELKRDRFCWL